MTPKETAKQIRDFLKEEVAEEAIIGRSGNRGGGRSDART